MELDFTGKTAVVTGGAQGIGMQTCAEFAAAGASVVIADSDRAAGNELLEELEAKGARCIFVQCDVADEEDIKALARHAENAFGTVDYLINNAGIGITKPIDHMSSADWDKVMNVNVRGAFLCTKYLLPLMRKAGGGAIVNISSTRALQSEADTFPYSASKGALLALTHSLAVSLSGDGVRVNAICPGWIDTSGYKKKSARIRAVLTEADHRQHPCGRVGEPRDIAAACLYLCSEYAGFITGANLVVDGGMTVKMIYV